jgi:K+-sensing histidine kinase KdpD
MAKRIGAGLDAGKIAAMPDFMSPILGPPPLTLGASKPLGFGLALALVAITTIVVGVLFALLHVDRIVGVYIIPVLIASIRWGLWPGVLAAVSSVALIIALFTPPPLNFQALYWEQSVRLAVFISVAVVASRLAVTLKQHAETAERAINETRRRAEADQLREALIGSVSHELRTPLASILGATTVLCSSPAVRCEPQLEGLADVVRTETERLNNVIQNLLDATRISSEGLRPRFEWAEVSDIVNAAIERRGGRLAGHPLEVDLSVELPLVYVDQVMVEQALGQLLDNAAKYSAETSPIRITARAADGAVVVSVIDRGAGLSPDELPRLGERFFRGSRTAMATTGSGFGIWIAKAFLHASGGSLTATSDGADQGATFNIRLPIPAQHPQTRDPDNE